MAKKTRIIKKILIMIESIKNKRFHIILNSYIQDKFDSKFRRKRRDEYLSRSTDIDSVFEILFPKISYQQNYLDKFEELEMQLDKFIESKKRLEFPSKVYPYHVDYKTPKNVRKLLFLIVLHSKPKLIYETGVANGFSSSAFLLALEQLKHGKVISFERLIFPWHSNEMIGEAIPDNLRKYHKIIVGDTIKNIKLNKVVLDIFFHDSDHTYQQMWNEYNLAWDMLKKGGLLISDDVIANDAFLNFSDNVNTNPIIFNNGKFGILVKQ